jgi:hypothetical protein
LGQAQLAELQRFRTVFLHHSWSRIRQHIHVARPDLLGEPQTGWQAEQGGNRAASLNHDHF